MSRRVPEGWQRLELGSILTESRIPVAQNDKSKRLTVRLHLQGVAKREERDSDRDDATIYFERKAGQFIYGKQNLFRGAVGLVPDDLDGHQSTQDVPAFDIAAGVDPRWLLHYFSRRSFYASLETIATGTGSKRIQPRELFEVAIDIPSIFEQRTIAEILDSVDATITATRCVIEQTRNLKRALMQELLTCGIPGRHTRFKDSPLGELPSDWRVAKLGDVATITNGATPSKKVAEYWEEGDIPWLPTAKVNDRIITAAENFITRKALNECPLSLIQPGSTLVAMIGQGKTRGMCAYLAIDAAVNQNFASIVPGPTLDGWFLFRLLSDQYDQLRNSGRGSNQGALNCAILKSYLIPLPNFDEQREIAALASVVAGREETEACQVKGLTALKGAALSGLLSGRIRVSNDDLLENITAG